jgi:hypothetical protein
MAEPKGHRPRGQWEAVGEAQAAKPLDRERRVCAEKWYMEEPRFDVGTWPCGASLTDVFHERHSHD